MTIPAKWGTRKQHKFDAANGDVSGFIESHFPTDYRGWCIDVGAADGVSTNSTYALEAQNMWTVLSVEANPYFRTALEVSRAFPRICAVGSVPSDSANFYINLSNLEAFSSLDPQPHPRLKEEAGENWAEIKVPVRTLDQLLAEHEFPKLDALCIDTEGTERDVLASINLKKWAPRVIVVECWDEGSLDDALTPFGYRRIFRSVDNYGYSLQTPPIRENA